MKLAKNSNERFINYSIVCIGLIEVSFKDKIYEQNLLTNVLSIIQYFVWSYLRKL
jgi:hypothetical protein